MRSVAFVRSFLFCAVLGFSAMAAWAECPPIERSLRCVSLAFQDAPGNPAADKQSTAPDGFSEEVAEQVIHRLSDGLVQHNARRMLSAFDPEGMSGYTNFSNQIQAMFQRYDSFRIHYRIASVEATSDGGTATVDLELEEMPRSSDDRLPVRKAEKIRLQMKSSKKGWKIVELQPRDFFS
jgi:hypothetical protein